MMDPIVTTATPDRGAAGQYGACTETIYAVLPAYLKEVPWDQRPDNQAGLDQVQTRNGVVWHGDATLVTRYQAISIPIGTPVATWCCSREVTRGPSPGGIQMYSWSAWSEPVRIAEASE